VTHSMEVSDLGARVVFSPRWWDFISTARRFVAGFCTHVLGDQEFSYRVALAAHEMMENGVKYSASKDALVVCTLRVDGDEVMVSVENEAHADQVAILQAEFDRVIDGDPLEVYVDKMAASLESSESQLGLARIRFEGGARLTLTVDSGRVTMGAAFPKTDSNGCVA